jgi:hypothetical protein
MKSANYVFVIILFFLFVGVQYISVVTLLAKDILHNPYMKIHFRDNIVRNIDIELYDADFLMDIPEGGIAFDNCTFLVDGGNYRIITSGWITNKTESKGER